MADPIRFHFRGAEHQVSDAAPTRTILQYLREDLRCTGTKEGCAEGDCGACTVVVGTLEGDQVELRTVNACIQFLPALDGKALFTVEDLPPADGGGLHPVQQAMVDCHASQCGFCTPGFVMSLWGMYLQQEGRCSLGRRDIDDALSGNLCRCTGYRPIIDAAQRMLQLPRVPFDRIALRDALRALRREQPLTYSVGSQTFHAPRTLAQALELRRSLPAALLVAGSTDVGLWVTKRLRELGEMIYLCEVEELQRVSRDGQALEIGAGVLLEDAYRELCADYPEVTQLWRRFASRPIRNAGTLGGNVANGSPIGDSMPWLIAAGAEVVLQGSQGRRSLALEDFYLGYQRKDLRPDEIVTAVRVPLPAAGLRLRTYKLAKRFDQDISAVCAAYAVAFDDEGRIRHARVAFGGMAERPLRARNTERALQDAVWDEVALEAGMEALSSDFTPLSDMRASRDYRTRAAQNLLRRFWLETRPQSPVPASVLNAYELT